MNQRDLQKMMQQAQQMQKQMGKIQDELANEIVEGTAGSYVKVTMNGHRELKSLTIAPEVVDPEDIETLQELLMTAFNDASQKATELSEQRMGALTGGMKLPGF